MKQHYNDEDDQLIRPRSAAVSHVQDMHRILENRDRAMQRARETVDHAYNEDMEVAVQPRHDPATEYTPLLNKVV